METESKNSLLLSVLINLIVCLLISTSIPSLLVEPLMRNQSLTTGSRYTITVDALNSISDDGIDSVIAIGSSMTLKSLDGRCVGDNLGAGTNVYNLAHSASKPYTDMQHIPRIISSNPEIVMMEISPDILTSPSTLSSLEYIELRYKIDSIYQDNSDLGDWLELVPEEYQKWIAKNEFERLQFRQEYFPSAIDQYLKRILLNETIGIENGNFGWVPMQNDDEWIEYLQTPIFPNDKFGIEGFDDEKMKEYNESKLHVKPWPKPNSNGTLSHDALEYEINSLLNAEIEIIILTPPYHPEHLEYLEMNQWDGLNQTIERYSQLPGITVFDQTWDTNWDSDDFYDRNHLDDDGRLKYCNRITPIIEQILDRT